jgi:starch synthase
MKILMATSETVPFAKTGGLADMVGALALELARAGHDVRLVLPRYYCIDRGALTQLEGAMGVLMGGREEIWCAVHTASLPGSPEDNPVRVYFIDHENFFGRDGIYGSPLEPDYHDNPRRFSFLSRAVFQLCRKIDWYPDILHAHDWPVALVPVYLKYLERPHGGFSRTASVLTIHNLGYQGIYPKDEFNYTGLGWDVFYNAGFEDRNNLNLMKAGLWSAEKLNTVSPGYARESQTPGFGFRLDGVLRARSADYQGILNGIDPSLWNPATDPQLPKPYDRANMGGKAKAKAALQREFGLPVKADIPIIGMVSRLTSQKGIGPLFGPGYGSAASICNMHLQFVVLGSGEAWCEQELQHLAANTSNFRVRLRYDEKIAHLLEAGSDFLLMPSEYEPCGLNQMYSLIYGTLPIVRNTGGLSDTVQNFNQETGEGTGFMFDDLNPQAIYDTVGWAIWAYYHRRSQLEEMRLRGMALDFSWKNSALQYEALYQGALAKL